METILEPSVCPACGQDTPSPSDGHWRWARGGKVYESVEQAESRLRTFSNDGFEFRAAVDSEGRVRIASRRKPA